MNKFIAQDQTVINEAHKSDVWNQNGDELVYEENCNSEGN